MKNPWPTPREYIPVVEEARCDGWHPDLERRCNMAADIYLDNGKNFCGYCAEEEHDPPTMRAILALKQAGMI